MIAVLSGSMPYRACYKKERKKEIKKERKTPKLNTTDVRTEKRRAFSASK